MTLNMALLAGAAWVAGIIVIMSGFRIVTGRLTLRQFGVGLVQESGKLVLLSTLSGVCLMIISRLWPHVFPH